MNTMYGEEAGVDADIETGVHDGTICLVGGSPRNLMELPIVVRLRVLDGTVWLTRSGDPHDYILASGEELEMERGALVIEALTPFAYLWLGHVDGSFSAADAAYRNCGNGAIVGSDCPAG
jgi:hypothetical protein